MIFYGFYKNQQTDFTVEDSNFSARPLELFSIHTNALTLHKTPRNNKGIAMWSSGAVTDAGGAIPARPTALAGREPVRGGARIR
jgi:hypothetical protein